MITALRLGNARLFDGDGWSFPFSSLTALCGTNSAGKSTALKALLLLRLNIGARNEIDPGRAKLRFSGSGTQIDLGNFKSFISHNCSTKELHLGVSIYTDLSPEGMDAIRGLPVVGSDPAPEEDERDNVPYALHCDFYFGLPETRQEKLGLTAPEESTDDLAADEQAVLNRAVFRIEDEDGATLLDFSIDTIEAELVKRRAYTLALPRRIYDSSFPSLIGLAGGDIDPFVVPTLLRGLLPDRWNLPVSSPKTHTVIFPTGLSLCLL